MSFFLTIFYIIVLFLRPQEFLEDLKGWPIVDYVAVFCVCAVFLEGSFTADKFRRSSLNWLVLLFWLTMPLSRIGNLWFGGALDAFLEFSNVALLYLLIILSVDSFSRLRKFVWFMILLETALAISAIVQYYTGVGLMGGEILHRGEIVQVRGIGIFHDPNDLALTIVSVVPFLLPAFHKPFLSRVSWTGVLFLIPMTMGVVFTRSRGGILGLAAVAWYYFYRRVGLFFSLIALGLLATVLVAIPRMESISTQESSARSRMEHWTHGLNLLRQNPVFGVGKDQFAEHYPQTAHNSFILVLSELGIIGGFVWVGMFFAAFREITFLRGDPRAPPFLQPWLDGLTGAILGWLTCAFFLSHPYKFLSFVLLALVVGTLNALQSEGITERHPWTIRQTLWTMGITVGAVILVHVMLRVLWSM